MSGAPPAQVSVIVPTMGRPASLDRAIRSVLAQTRRDGVELIVVDNDPTGSAKTTVAACAEGAPFPVGYVAEPAPGVSNARNAGLAAAQGALIAFLDDDESAPERWLERLLAAQGEFQADVVFGPVDADLPPGARRHRAFLQRFFSRVGPEQSGPSPDYHGCGNCLIRRAALPDPVRPFAVARNRIGGEDDLLFGAMQALGARFAWAANAGVTEHVPDSRATLTYALRRGFAYGQGPSSACAAAGPQRWPMVAVWMAVGLGQAFAYGVLALWKAVRRVEVAATLDRAVQGLGKLLWFPPFKLVFYGRAPTPSAMQGA